MLTDRVAIVTGAGGGIGRAFSLALARNGAQVMCADVDEDTARATAEMVRAEGLRADHVRLDQADPASCGSCVDQTVQRFGGLDVLVNNASLFSGLARMDALDIPVDEWRRVVDVNLSGVFFCLRAALPVMLERGYGKVVNIASSSVFRAENRLAHYVAAKMGVVGLTRALAREYSDRGVTINALSPGATDSGSRISTPEYLERLTSARSIKRVQVPDDLVGSLLYLVSPASDFLTGQHLVVDGGSEFQ